MDKDYDINYKIQANKPYLVYANNYQNKIYYKTSIKKRNAKGENEIFYKQLRFVNCTPPENCQMIKILHGFEDLYTNNKDPYNPISVIVVQNYEIVKSKEEQKSEAQEKFDEIMANEGVDINIDDLPF